MKKKIVQINVVRRLVEMAGLQPFAVDFELQRIYDCLKRVCGIQLRLDFSQYLPAKTAC